MFQKVPRVVSVKQKTLDGRYQKENYFKLFASEAGSLLTDHEVRILVLWALVSPSAAVAYLVWKKYEKLKWVAAILFAVSIFQFVGQWGGVYWAIGRFLGVH
ncbi:MAG: hypothetical protein Q8P02_05185 [Candidatus Micrarchaeota archaeon]|nr:hypothetical protein [Candidatus Micrarchaeota archaeon]